MSKYDALWAYVKEKEEERLILSFHEVQEIAGVPLDHSFLKFKKELESYKFQVEKISIKNQTVSFTRMKS